MRAAAHDETEPVMLRVRPTVKQGQGSSRAPSAVPAAYCSDRRAPPVTSRLSPPARVFSTNILEPTSNQAQPIIATGTQLLSSWCQYGVRDPFYSMCQLWMLTTRDMTNLQTLQGSTRSQGDALSQPAELDESTDSTHRHKRYHTRSTPNVRSFWGSPVPSWALAPLRAVVTGRNWPIRGCRVRTPATRGRGR